MVGFGCLGGRWWDEGGGDRLVELAVWGRWCVMMGWVSVVAGCWRAGMRVCWRRGLGGGCVRRVGGGLAVVWVGGAWWDAEAVKGGLVAGGWRGWISCTVGALGVCRWDGVVICVD